MHTIHVTFNHNPSLCWAGGGSRILKTKTVPCDVAESVWGPKSPAAEGTLFPRLDGEVNNDLEGREISYVCHQPPLELSLTTR